MSGDGHIANQCPSPTKTLLVHVPIEEDEDDGLEVVVHQQNDSNASTENSEFDGYIRILALDDLTLTYDRAHLEVARCTLA